MKKENDYQQLKAISLATLIEESSHTKLILKGVVAIAAVILLLIIWSAFTKIDQIAVSQGKIIPLGNVQIIQHLEGGIVAKILVKNGSVVKQGQVLIKMNPTATRAELERLRSQEVGFIIDKQRLDAFIKNKPADLVQWGNAVIQSQYNSVKNKQQITSLLGDEKKHLESQYATKEDQESSLIATLKHRKEQLENSQNQLNVWNKHIKLLQRELDMYEKLKKTGVVSQRDYLIKLREMNQARGNKLKLSSEIEQAQQTLEEAKSKLMALSSTLQQEALVELGTTNDRLLQIQHQIEKLEAQLQRIEVTAPLNGIIKGIEIHPGSVIQPGGRLLELVPSGQALVVETHIQQKDIGHVKIGDPVTVKVLTYDFSRFGSIDGKLIELSASTFTDEKEQQPFYKGMIELKQQYLQKGREKKRLLPGMAVEANIITGQRTLLAYLLKPVTRATSGSFHER